VRQRLTFLWCLMFLAAVPARADRPADEIHLQNPYLRATVSAVGGLPLRWESCEDSCASGGARTRVLLGTGAGTLQWEVHGNAEATRRLRSLNYVRVEQSGETRTGRVTVRSAEKYNGRFLMHRYELADDGQALKARLDVPTGAGIRFDSGPEWVPEPLPGFGAMYGEVRPVIVDGDGQDALAFEDGSPRAREVSGGQWSGVRNRFWALLFRAEAGAALHVEWPELNRPAVVFSPAATGTALRVQIYGGPVETGRLSAVDPVLREMLFAALWDWLRWLCFGMLYLLNWFQGTLGSAGLAIVLLSLAVKILMWPLTHVADRWQSEVNEIASRLKPHLDAVKKEFKGEEAHKRTLAVYSDHGVHPMYTLKSLAGFLIQIPVFIAAFDMLGENFALNQTPFLWIADLARPDHWMALPFSLPFFGGHLNLLPCLMTGFTLCASMLQTEASLSPALMRQQRVRLYLMAAAFFVLFYTFPAGMVLYWTTNNVLHLIKVLFVRWRGASSALAAD
jgi:YidC/Oxa1 family membrane protein insertase